MAWAAIGARLWPQAQGQCRSGRPAASGGLGLTPFGDCHRAAGTSHGYDFFPWVTGEIAFRMAWVSGKRAKRNQTRRTGRPARPRWTGRNRRPGFTGRSRRAFFTLRSGRPRGSSRAGRSLRALEAARECECRQYCNHCNGSAHRDPFPAIRDFKRSISFQLSQSTSQTRTRLVWSRPDRKAPAQELNGTFGRAAY